MTAIVPTKDPASNAVAITWRLSAGESGEWESLAIFGDRCAQFVLDGGGTLKLEGSNDKVTVFTLHDPFGTALSYGANTMAQILETPRWVRPVLTGGTTATCSIWARRTLR